MLERDANWWHTFVYQLVYPAVLGSMLYDALRLRGSTLSWAVLIFYCVDYLYIYLLKRAPVSATHRQTVLDFLIAILLGLAYTTAISGPGLSTAYVCWSLVFPAFLFYHPKTTHRYYELQIMYVALLGLTMAGLVALRFPFLASHSAKWVPLTIVVLYVLVFYIQWRDTKITRGAENREPSVLTINPLQVDHDFSNIQKPAAELLTYWEKISEMHRHEDVLLNSRLHAFLITTAFLFAGYAQFQNRDGLRVGLCTVAFLFTAFAMHVLRRTARAIEWYIDELVALEVPLFDYRLRPYLKRRVCTGSYETSGRRKRYPVSRLLAIWLPSCAAVLWLLLVWRDWPTVVQIVWPVLEPLRSLLT